MKPKTQRMLLVTLGLASMFTAIFFVLGNFRDNLVFFYTPTELAQKPALPERDIRIGGLVVENSIARNGQTVEFTLTDTNTSITVRFTGTVPALFRAGQGIVAHGRRDEHGVFISDNLLAKHDEKYMPPEVAEALKKSGNWKP